MIIDPPRKQDIPALRGLWKEAFGDSEEFLDLFFQTGFAPGRSRCLWISGKVAAALYWFDCSHQEKKLAYIYAVATDKAYRGRGLCTALMEDTHRHLQALGYDGAVLVPGNRKLFDLYGKLGYKAFCPMTVHSVESGATAEALEKLSAEEFRKLRRKHIPAGGILQEGETLAFLSGFCRFCRSGDDLCCLSVEGDTAYFQEYLGAESHLPGILKALGVKKGIVQLPGGENSAMYYPLTEKEELPTYLGISLG